MLHSPRHQGLQITEYYRHKADRWARGSAPYQQPIIASFLAQISIQGDLTGWLAMDFGVGVGLNLPTLSGYIKRIVAIDVSMDGLREARTRDTRGASALFAAYDGDHLPLPDATFDLVICTEVLEHVTDFHGTMSEILRVLRPGGFLIVSVPNYFNLTGLVKFMRDTRAGYSHWEPWGSHPGGFERFTTSLMLEHAVRQLGLNVLSARGANLSMGWPGMAGMPLGRRVLAKLEQYPASWRFCMNYFMLAQSSKE